MRKFFLGASLVAASFGMAQSAEFTLAVSGKFLGADFPASVHFVGTK